MEKGLYPLSGVSMDGEWWWCSMFCWVVPTRGGPTTDVGVDLLGQPWEGRDFTKPLLGRNNTLPWPAGNSPSHGTQCFCRDSMAWAGGEWDLEEKLVCSWMLLRWCPVTAAALVFGGEEREAELLGWPDLVLTETSIKFPWLSRWRHHCKVFWGQHLQESKNWKGSQLLWSWVAGCFPKCSHPCGPWPQHPFSAFQAELQEKQLFGFFPTLPKALSPIPVAAWQCLSWWRRGRMPREGGKMAHHFVCVKIPGSVFSTFPDTSILLSAALSQLYSLQWFSSLNKCRLFREHFLLMKRMEEKLVVIKHLFGGELLALPWDCKEQKWDVKHVIFLGEWRWACGEVWIPHTTSLSAHFTLFPMNPDLIFSTWL